MLSLVWIVTDYVPFSSVHSGVYVEDGDQARFASDGNAHWHTAEEALDFPATDVVFVGGPNASRFVIQPGDASYDAPCHGCAECSAMVVELASEIQCGECGRRHFTDGTSEGDSL